jgi:hypothetical protein
MNTRVIGTAAVLIFLLGACSAKAGESEAKVATLSSAPASAAATKAAKEPPLIRPDTSDAEETRLWDIYQDCVAENGGTTRRKNAADAGAGAVAAPNTDPEFEKRSKKAEAACADKLPEQLWERAKRTDAKYADKLRDWVTCIRAAGIDAWEDDGYLAFEHLPPDNQMKKVDACEAKAFA